MTPAQLQAIKADIIAKQAQGQPLAGLNEEGIAAYYNAASEKIVWRTNVTRAEIYHQTSAEATNWNWTTYKAQNATEQNAWVQMFMGDVANLSLANFRAGVAAIFGAANAQTVHVLATGKRAANRLESLFAVGTGSLAVPAMMAVEGSVTAQQISDIIAG